MGIKKNIFMREKKKKKAETHYLESFQLLIWQISHKTHLTEVCYENSTVGVKTYFNIHILSALVYWTNITGWKPSSVNDSISLWYVNIPSLEETIREWTISSFSAHHLSSCLTEITFIIWQPWTNSYNMLIFCKSTAGWVSYIIPGLFRISNNSFDKGINILVSNTQNKLR